MHTCIAYYYKHSWTPSTWYMPHIAIHALQIKNQNSMNCPAEIPVLACFFFFVIQMRCIYMYVCFIFPCWAPLRFLLPLTEVYEVTHLNLDSTTIMQEKCHLPQYEAFGRALEIRCSAENVWLKFVATVGRWSASFLKYDNAELTQ